MPDKIHGQAVKVFLVPCNGELDVKMVLRHCAGRLEPFMVPKYIELIPALPKTDNGKVNRRALQAIEER